MGVSKTWELSQVKGEMHAMPGRSGPAVVTRRLPGTLPATRPGSRQASAGRLAPQAPVVRKSIDSTVSTGSQSEFFDSQQTIILFDWDDTLCPSTWLQKNQRELNVFRVGPGAAKHQRLLLELQKQVDVLLRSAMTMGKVIIVTNATEPWVSFSCKTFLPQLVGLVSSLPVIYARTAFRAQTTGGMGSKLRSASSGSLGLPALPKKTSSTGCMGIAAQLNEYQNAPQRWKEVAFLNEITGFYSRYERQSWKNIISIGDSVFERDAARRVVFQRPSANKKCRLKTAKLLDDPSLEEVIVQVRLLVDSLKTMVQTDSDLNIEIDENDLEMDFIKGVRH